MSDESQDLLDIPAFLRRTAPIRARDRIITESNPSRPPRDEWLRSEPTERPTPEQAAALGRLGWSEEQIARVLRSEADVIIELRSPPSARTAP